MLNQPDKIAVCCQDLMSSAFAEKRLALSAISAWEVGMLVSKQRLQLDLPCLEWVKQASEGFTLLPLGLDNDGKILDYAKQHGVVSVLAVR